MFSLYSRYQFNQMEGIAVYIQAYITQHLETVYRQTYTEYVNCITEVVAQSADFGQFSRGCYP
jgi:hypothetical protein